MAFYHGLYSSDPAAEIFFKERLLGLGFFELLGQGGALFQFLAADIGPEGGWRDADGVTRKLSDQKRACIEAAKRRRSGSVASVEPEDTTMVAPTQIGQARGIFTQRVNHLILTSSQ